MFPFFKKNKNGEEEPQKQGNDSTIDASSILGTEQKDPSDENLVDTELSIHPDWKAASERHYVYAFFNSQCAPLKPNQLSLSGIEMKKKGTEYQFTAFIRQTLENAISLNETPILLIGPDNEKLGRKVFDLKPAGKLPAKSSRPWYFTFSERDLFTTDIPQEGWKLAFELRPSSRKNALDLADSWKKSLADEDKKKLEGIVQQAKPLKPGEINFMNIEAKRNEKGDLAVTLLLRNGNDKTLFFDQLPIQVEDGSGDVVAKGNFTLNKFEVKGNTSKPWTFVFPKSLLLKDDIDLSKWKAYPIQK